LWVAGLLPIIALSHKQIVSFFLRKSWTKPIKFVRKKMEQKVSLTRTKFKQGLKLSNGTTYRIKIIKNNLRVRLEINPSDFRSLDDTFTLIGEKDPDQIAYQQVKTCKDDIDEANEYVDLIFFDLMPDITYSLEINPGSDGECYYAFEDMPWSELELFLIF
jgi:hypothetical protein